MPHALPPYLVTPLPRCSIILERHTHKNGGSTFRSIINTNDMFYSLAIQSGLSAFVTDVDIVRVGDEGCGASIRITAANKDGGPVDPSRVACLHRTTNQGCMQSLVRVEGERAAVRMGSCCPREVLKLFARAQRQGSSTHAIGSSCCK